MDLFLRIYFDYLPNGDSYPSCHKGSWTSIKMSFACSSCSPTQRDFYNQPSPWDVYDKSGNESGTPF